MATHFGDWLVSKRGQRGEPGFISQAELARRMSVDPTYISQLEKRTTAPSYETRQRIHDALGTTEDELIALGIVRTRGARPEPVQRAINEPRPSYAAADAFIRSLSDDQKRLLRAALDAADTVAPIDDTVPDADDRRAAHGR